MHLISFLDRQSVDVISPALDHQFRIGRVTILCEPEHLADARHSARLLRQRALQVFVVPIGEAWRPASITETLDRILAVRPEPCLINLSCANGMQAAVAQCYASRHGLPSFVIQPADDQLIWIDGLPTNYVADGEAIADSLKLEECFALFGHPWLACQYRLGQRDHGREVMARQLLQLAIDDPGAIRLLNLAGAQLQDGYLSQPLRPPIPPGLLSLIQESGWASWQDDVRIDFRSAETRAFLCGGWLELAVFCEVVALAQAGLPLQDAACGVRIGMPDGVSNEYDLALLANNQLYLVECKTVLNARQRSVGMDVLFKLDSVSQLGGLEAEAMLITLNQPTAAESQRARAQALEIIAGPDLANLRERLHAWLAGGTRQRPGRVSGWQA